MMAELNQNDIVNIDILLSYALQTRARKEVSLKGATPELQAEADAANDGACRSRLKAASF